MASDRTMRASAAGRRVWAPLLAVGVIGLVVGGVSASAVAQLSLSGGPQYAPPGGGSCSASGTPCSSAGATVTCTGLNPDNLSNLYFGVRNDQFVLGDSETGSAGPAAGSPAVFRSDSMVSDISIHYVGSTSVRNNILNTDQAVATGLTLAVTNGTTTLAPTGGNPPNNNNGDIGNLFRVTSSNLTVSVKITGSLSIFVGGASCPAIFDPAHAHILFLRTNQDISHVDLGFYWTALPPPHVVSIATQGATSTNADSVVFRVTFNVPVSGVDPGDFAVTPPFTNDLIK